MGSPCDDLEVGHLFPSGALSIKILELPGKGLKLPNDWRIFVSSGRGSEPLNQAVKMRFNREWHGNIVLALYSCAGQRRRKLNNVPLAQAPFVNLLLKWCVVCSLQALLGDGLIILATISIAFSMYTISWMTKLLGNRSSAGPLQNPVEQGLGGFEWDTRRGTWLQCFA